MPAGKSHPNLTAFKELAYGRCKEKGVIPIADLTRYNRLTQVILTIREIGINW